VLGHLKTLGGVVDPPPPPPPLAVGNAMAAERKVARVRTNEVFILMVGFGFWGKKLGALEVLERCWKEVIDDCVMMMMLRLAMK
jgi:hypothetical protein